MLIIDELKKHKHVAREVAPGVVGFSLASHMVMWIGVHIEKRIDFNVVPFTGSTDDVETLLREARDAWEKGPRISILQ